MTDPTTKTSSGRVRGLVAEDQLVFLGIPYASPPFGELRFAPPEPPAKWSGTRDCLAYGPTAPQRDPGITIIPEPVEHGDDCLNLNVFTPDVGDARLPVLVWIHGGGFVSGCNRSPWYWGTRFARDGVVVVNVGYRLGIEGFLDIDGAPPNRAVLDWLTALEWVQENIGAFGGDPRRVTIGGQSAGSAACLTLLADMRANSLFRRVIAMSGTSDTRMPRSASTELGEKIAAQLGARPRRDELAAFTPDELMDAFDAVAKNPFTAEAIGTGFDPRRPALKPYVDGEVIPEHPFRAIASGVGRDHPMLAGSTTQELNAAIRTRRSDLEGGGATQSLEAMNITGEQLEAYARHVDTDDHVELFAQAVTDRAFRASLARLLDERAETDATTFGYQFDWRSPVSGATHCLDLPFAWDNLDADRVTNGLIGPNAPQALADEMHRAWVGFITAGDPGWAPYELKERHATVFGEVTSIANDPLGALRDVFA